MFLRKLIICVFIVCATEVRSQGFSRGYSKNTHHEEKNILHAPSDLTPNCEQDCTYGECSPNNDCICFEGFERYPPGSNSCIPKCDSGYKRVDGVCLPHCSKPCGLGTCTAPEQCSCDNGLAKNIFDECISTCHPECGHGICDGWNHCTCWAGFEWRKDGDPQCVKQKVAQNLTVYSETPKEKSAENTFILNLLYTALAFNIILLIVVTIILVKHPGILKCDKFMKRSNSNSTIECNEQGYVVMHSSNNGSNRSSNIYSYAYILPKMFKEKVMSEGRSTRTSSVYDCVQV